MHVYASSFIMFIHSKLHPSLNIYSK